MTRAAAGHPLRSSGPIPPAEPRPTPPGPLTDAAAANARRARAVLLAVAASVALVVAVLVTAALLVAGLDAVLSLPAGLLVGVLAGSLAARWASTRDGQVLAALGARLVPVEEEPSLHNVVEGLCAVAGLPKPALFVVDDDACNALSLGRDQRQASLVVTSGLLRALERIELEGVVAHELAHIKALDCRVASVAAALAPLGPRVADALLGDGREEAADAAGVAMTRYPPGLTRALEKVAARPTVPGSSTNATSRLWLAPDPHVGGGLLTRIEELREL